MSSIDMDLAEWRERIGVRVMHKTTCLHVAEDFGDGAVCKVCFANTQRIGALIEAAVRRAWDEGYTSGHSNAMRRMSDEPNAPTTPNPYRQAHRTDLGGERETSGAHSKGCEDWRAASPGQRSCVCHVSADVPDDY